MSYLAAPNTSLVPTHHVMSRSISLLNVFSKLIEKLMHKRLYSFLMKNNILDKYQLDSVIFFDYFSIEVIDNLIQNMENGNISVGIYLDLRSTL